MTTQLYLWCGLAAILGMFAYIFIVKIPASMKKADALKIKFEMKDYFIAEYPALLGNISSIAIALLIVGEALKYKPEIQGFIITIFAFYGFTGSSILLAIFGQINKKLNSIIDIKAADSDANTTTPTIKDINEVK